MLYSNKIIRIENKFFIYIDFKDFQPTSIQKIKEQNTLNSKYALIKQLK